MNATNSPLPLAGGVNPLRFFARNWPLTWAMAKREITDRYVGQMFGLGWAVVHPLLLMAVYLFIFAFVFKTRVGNTVELPFDYSVYLLSGLIPWLAMAECMNKATTTITGNVNLVKQVVFPLEVLPLKGILATLLPQVICTLLLLVYMLACFQYLPWTVALLPALIALQMILMVGLALFLAALGPYFRDLKDFVQVFCLVGVYLIPIVYLPDMVPGAVRPLLQFNPFSHLIWCYHDVFFYGGFEHPFSWIILAVLGLLSCWVGARVFEKLKPYFGNVL
ncbi:MAG: ABC transporter permease [Gemmataceae bacterium]|nr:ABC transporter permease [Gemmataceae bacterium]MCI0738369.1 ABC transporter permease [Gemmataceae bacterium]